MDMNLSCRTIENIIIGEGLHLKFVKEDYSDVCNVTSKIPFQTKKQDTTLTFIVDYDTYLATLFTYLWNVDKPITRLSLMKNSSLDLSKCHTNMFLSELSPLVHSNSDIIYKDIDNNNNSNDLPKKKRKEEKKEKITKKEKKEKITKKYTKLRNNINSKQLEKLKKKERKEVEKAPNGKKRQVKKEFKQKIKSLEQELKEKKRKLKENERNEKNALKEVRRKRKHVEIDKEETVEEENNDDVIIVPNTRGFNLDDDILDLERKEIERTCEALRQDYEFYESNTTSTSANINIVSPGPLPKNMGKDEQCGEYEDNLACIICTDRKKRFMCEPCKHAHFCGTCIIELVALNGDHVVCPTCSQPVTTFVQIFYE
jgi:hypothetical protein